MTQCQSFCTNLLEKRFVRTASIFLSMASVFCWELQFLDSRELSQEVGDFQMNSVANSVLVAHVGVCVVMEIKSL